ncbi:MAG: hypothetical protein JSS10_07025 [Verrucomicrobia bacterium]|nr:hypothetical protein [Verrucomicrobiota bacterium]
MTSIPPLKNTSSTLTDPNTSPTDSLERLAEKIKDTSLESPRNEPVSWDDSRAVTPGGLCGYRSQEGLQFFNLDEAGTVKLFRSGKKSQGLFVQDDKPAAASVTTDIKTKTVRKKEKKKTFVQYEKKRIKQKDVDFHVDETDYRGWVNYAGGHLIDYKYCADHSHTEPLNYFPTLHYYNLPLKEYLVKQYDNYIEMPVYTPNPPSIGVKGKKDTFQFIPIGMILIQISNKKMENAYYFPNNQFDYQNLKEKLGTKKHATNMVRYFKLRREFLKLLHPALIHDLENLKDGQSKQSKQEDKFYQLFTDVSNLSLRENSNEEENLSRFIHNIFRNGQVNARICLECDDDEFDTVNDPFLAAAFQYFGKFIVQYCVKNALKSEVLSIKTRLAFLDVIANFLNTYFQDKESDPEFVQSLAQCFISTLKVLDKLTKSMNNDELTFLAYIYLDFTDPYINSTSEYLGLASFIESNKEFSFFNMEYYFRKCIEILTLFEKNLLKSKSNIPLLSGDFAWRFLSILRETQDSLNYLIEEMKYDEEDFSEEILFLKKMSPLSLQLLSTLATNKLNIQVKYQIKFDIILTHEIDVESFRKTLEDLG